MKVLHVIASVSPLWGGASQAALATVKALRDYGIDAEITTTNDHGPQLLDVPLCQRIEYKQVPVRFFPRFSSASEAVQKFCISNQLTAWLWQHATDYDLFYIYSMFLYPPTVAMRIAHLKHVPYIVRPQGLLCEWSLQQSKLKKHIYLSLMERSNLNCSQALHFMSEQEQQQAFKLGLKPTSFVVPNGFTSFPPLLDARHRLRQLLNVLADEPIILFLSRLHPKKGLDCLIPALAKIAHQRFTFVLAGSGASDYEAEVKSLLVSAGIQHRTYCCGFVEGEMKNLLLQGADLFALTSHSENFGIALLEALTVGLPVVVTPGVALASVVKQNQLGYVPELDSTAIAAVLEHCLNYPQQAKQMGMRARDFILQNYTWEESAQKLSKIYAAVINSKPLPEYWPNLELVQ